MANPLTRFMEGFEACNLIKKLAIIYEKGDYQHVTTGAFRDDLKEIPDQSKHINSMKTLATVNIKQNKSSIVMR